MIGETARAEGRRVSTDVASAEGMPILGLDDVPRARHYITAVLRDSADDDLVDMAQLATTELVTNALLHAGPPITLRVTYRPGKARIEVSDASPVLPEVGLSGEDEMTGRGLALVEALAAGWGAAPLGEGKVVWCELDDGAEPGRAPTSAPNATPTPTSAPPPDASAVPAPSPAPSAESLPEQPEPTRAVTTIPGVPVTLLLATESHVDGLVRDLTLAASSTSEQRQNTVPADVAARVEAAAAAVAPLRRSLKRQALDARAAGADETAITVALGRDVVELGAEFLQALDEADGYSRANRLLTLEASPQQRVFRRWMADQIRAATSASDNGDPLPPVEPFRDRLLAELATLAVVQRTAARASRLHRVATGLSEARTPEQVAGVVLEEGSAALGAVRGALVRLEGEDLILAGALGLGATALDRAAKLRLDDHFPSTDAIRSREPVWVESRSERDRRYPEVRDADPSSRSVVAAPLLVGDRVLGVLRFGFDSDLVVDDDERDFVRALAAQAASALDRSLAYAAEHVARQNAERTANRLARLQEVTAALSGTLDEAEVARLVLGHAVQALGAGVGALCLLDRPGTPATLKPDAEIRIAHAAGLADEADELWGTFRLSDPLPASEAIRLNEAVLLDTVAERIRRYPTLVAGMPTAEHALAVMPLSVGERRLGALALSFFDGWRLTEDDQRFLSSLADACAQALDRSSAVRQLRAVSARLAFLAEASVELASTLDYRQTLTRIAELAVPVLADWCSVATVEDGTLQTLAVAHVDPAKIALGEELERRYPPNPGTSAPYRVLRSRQTEIINGITDAMVESSAVDDEHRQLLRDIGAMRAVMFVPMLARDRTLGVLTLVSSADDRTFGPEDVALAEDLARRAAVAIDNARLFRDATGDVAG